MEGGGEGGGTREGQERSGWSGAVFRGRAVQVQGGRWRSEVAGNLQMRQAGDKACIGT